MNCNVYYIYRDFEEKSCIIYKSNYLSIRYLSKLNITVLKLKKKIPINKQIIITNNKSLNLK